jgi:hypothetical protein
LIVTSNYSNLTVQRKPFKPDLKSTTRKPVSGIAITFSYKKEDDAKIYYDQAIGRLKKTQMKFTVSPVHSKKKLLDYALKSYQIASDLEPKYNFNYQKAYFMVN